MANFPLAAGKIGKHAVTLTASTIDSVVFVEDLDQVEVYSTGAAAVAFTVDGSDPVVGGDGSWELPAGAAAARTVPVPTAGPTTVKVLSAGTPQYSVSRVA